jgi:hypothetical protein
MVFFIVILTLVLLYLGMVSLALPGDSICGLSSNCRVHDAWRTCHDGFVFCSACKFFFVCFVVDTTFVVGDVGHEFAPSA